MHHLMTFSTMGSLLLLAGCTFGTPGETGGEAQSSAASEVSSVSSIQETANVTYTGTVEPAGISIYQEGTHRLALANGRFILLESTLIDLNGYVGEDVTVFGSLRPTVEAGGMIMRVEGIELIEESSSSVSSLQSESSSSADATSSAVVSSVSSRIPESAPSSIPQSSVSSIDVADPELQSRIELMAQEDLASGNWTQDYCTAHIGFCVPVHRNWWFKSFGTTTTYLWHVEISTEEIFNIGEGPISINLLSGSSPVADGTVRTEGNLAVGYRSWTDNRYFVIRGDASLSAAISTITASLESYSEAEEAL